MKVRIGHWTGVAAFAVIWLGTGCRSQNSGQVQDAASADGPTLSQTYQTNCARCHGRTGKGLSGPDLTRKDVYSFDDVLRQVRSGKGGQMPAFTNTDYSTDQLKLDVAALKTGLARAPDPNAPLPEFAPGRVGTPEEQHRSAEHYQTESHGSTALFGMFGVEPFVLPYIKCMDLPDIANPGTKSRHCANVIISGSTDEGYRFADFGVCKDIRTQRPFNAKELPSTVETFADDARLKDTKFMGELAWVNSQIRSSGCVCCHDSSIDKKVAYWDISAPGVPIWTDQLNAYAIEVFTGRVDSTALGRVPLDLNHGFDRSQVGLPSTDSKRMQDFFLGLAKKKGTTARDIKAMAPLADLLASQLRTPPTACPAGVGVYADNTVHWDYVDWYHVGDSIKAFLNTVQGLDQPSEILDTVRSTFAKEAPFLQQAAPIARYVYVLREDSVTPLVPPNLDRPAGMLWRLDRSRLAFPFISGLVRYPTKDKPRLPLLLASQAFPDNDALPEPLVPGQKYYLNAQIDMGLPAARCIFTYPASPG